MATMSVSGVVSGMDWDSMIDEIITNAAKPAQVKVNKKTNLTNKKSLFEEMKVTMNSLQSSLSPLKLPSTYKAKTIDIERLDSTKSYKGVLTATVNADAEVNVWDVEVKQLASAQTNRSKQITASNLNSTLSGVTGSTMYINAGGQKIGVEVKSSDTLESLKSRINTTLKTLDNPIHVTASVVDNKLILKSDYTGLGAFTANETINYSSNGVNTITGFSVSDDTRENVKITNGSTTYTHGTDYVIVNGNEIRWKKFDQSKEVALDDTVTVKYNMAAEDKYEKTGTYGSSEADISRLSMIDNGTLSSRLKITDDNNVTYTYGKDFTLDSSGKVVWLEESEATTNEPDSYTVSYSETTTYSHSTGRNKASTTINYTDEPESYIVKYNDRATGSYDITFSKSNDTSRDAISIDLDELGKLYKNEKGSELDTVTYTVGQRNVEFLDPADRSAFTLTSGSTSYEYGKDYVIANDSNNPGWKIVWGRMSNGSIGGIVNTFMTKEGITGTPQAVPSTGDSVTFSFAYSYDYSLTGRVSASDNDKTIHTIFGQDIENFDSSKLVIRGYENGNDFEVSTVDGEDEISWITKSKTVPSKDDEIPAAHMTKFQEAYKNANGTSIPTISLTDADGVIRTYLDLTGDSNFTLGSYEYGRDYVIRVNDDRNGYVISWAITDDENGDGKVDINDSNTVVTTYTQEKGISTENMKQSPSAGSYMGLIAYSKDVTTTTTGEVSKTSTDKSLSSILPEATVSDYSQLVISDGTKTYAYGTDWTIDGSGNITWIKQSSSTYTPLHPADGATYTLSYEAFEPFKATGTYSNATQEADFTTAEGYGNIDGNKLSYEQILKYVDIAPTSETPQSKIDGSMEKYFTLTDGTTTYTYGTDYRIIKGTAQDSDSSEYQPMIEWISGGNTPSVNFILTFTGGSGEVLTTDGVKRSATDSVIGSPLATDFDGGTNTITYGTKTFYEGIDFNIDADSSGYATVTWISDDDGGYEWYYPTSNSYYTINHTDDNGNTTTYKASRTGSATLNIADYGMTTATGSISVQYGNDHSYRLDAAASGDGASGYDVIKGTYGIDITSTTGGTYTFNWVAPTLTSRTNLPAYGTELTVSYEYDANTFDLSDDGNGDLLQALGFTKSDGTYDDYTAAKNAILVIDGGQEVERDSNDIGADYENELIKGVTMHLKGLGEVSLDISQDAEKAVESIQTFVDNYNDLMTWMNTRMTEKQLDEDTAATVDSDDFRMRWGLLHGNSLLRQTKSQMRSLTSQNFTFSFTQRKSSGEIYGTMGFNGLKSSSTLRLRIGTKYVDVTIDPADTLETIVAKISDDSKGGAMNDIYYDDNGEKLRTPLLKAYVENDKLVIQSSDNSEITMSGSAAMNALKMNYTYKGLYQIGIESTSEDYGKSGELVFDANEFMKALEDNPDEVQALMMKFVTQFDTWTKSMLNSSSSGETSGTLTREIENIQSQIDSINEYLETYQERLDRMEENLRTRYGNTETQFARLSQQASSIAAILNQLNGTAQGGGYGQTSS